MSEENKELEFDEAVKSVNENECCKNEDSEYDKHYRKTDIARLNINAREAEGKYFNDIGSTKAELIKVLKETLGTMVQEPTFESDPNSIGSKQFKMYIQKPIVEGEDRNKVVKKLVELIDSL